MRYLRVLILAVFIFLCLVFFFQNQAPLSQEMQMSLNLFFIPPMTSISLPFYFLLIAAFFVGAILCWLMLLWDRLNISARCMSAKHKAKKLEKQVAELQAIIDKSREKEAASLAIPANTAKAAESRDHSAMPPKPDDEEVSPKD